LEAAKIAKQSLEEKRIDTINDNGTLTVFQRKKRKCRKEENVVSLLV
jgi:hypothetical protein